MALENTRLEQLGESDLQRLVDDAVREGRTIDYKLLVGLKDDAKKEFLKDVSSLANSAGGDLVIGVREDPPGVPAELVGLPAASADQELQRLENLLRDAVEPRIPGVTMMPIPVHAGSEVVLVIRVPRSLAAPHVVTFGNHWRFYGRNSSGSYPLDVPEVRSAFSLSESRISRLREFRIDRLARIKAGETPLPMMEGAKVVLHLVPLDAIGAPPRFSVDDLRGALGQVLPLSTSMTTHRHNLDGLLMYWRHAGEDLTGSYLQIHRTGIIEAVDASLLSPLPERDDLLIPSTGLLNDLNDALTSYTSFLLGTLGVAPPLFVLVSLLDVEGYGLAVRQDLTLSKRGVPIDRADLVLPEEIIEELPVQVDTILRPVLDGVWNAAGWERCLDYDETGSPRGRR